MWRKRGQTALEFLMQYGWGLIVLAAIFAGLSYAGVFSGKQVIMSQCFAASGISCRDYKATETTAFLTLRNSYLEDLVQVDVEFTGDVASCDTDILNPSGGTVWADDDCADSTTCIFNMTAGEVTHGHDIATFQFTNCNTFEKAVVTDFTVFITKKGEGVDHSAVGKASLRVES